MVSQEISINSFGKILVLLFFGLYILAMKQAISLNFRLKELLLVFLRRIKIGDI
jgi:hypothetical protein